MLVELLGYCMRWVTLASLLVSPHNARGILFLTVGAVQGGHLQVVPLEFRDPADGLLLTQTEALRPMSTPLAS